MNCLFFFSEGHGGAAEAASCAGAGPLKLVGIIQKYIICTTATCGDTEGRETPLKHSMEKSCKYDTSLTPIVRGALFNTFFYCDDRSLMN